MTGTFFSATYNRILATLALVALVAALAAYAFYTFKQAEYFYTGPTTISVAGEGEVLATPDIGQFSFSVMATGSDATAAQSDSASKINGIIAYLKEQGVEERDIKTEQYSLYPRYRWEEQVCVIGRPCTPGQQIEDGFEVSQMVTVKVRDLTKSGDLISGVGGRGATNISGLAFTVDDEEALKDDARALAIKNAKEKSEALARELGVRVVRMVGYYEEQNEYPMPYGKGGDMMEAAMSPRPADAPALPMGESNTTVRVNITYQVE